MSTFPTKLISNLCCAIPFMIAPFLLLSWSSCLQHPQFYPHIHQAHHRCHHHHHLTSPSTPFCLIVLLSSVIHPLWSVGHLSRLSIVRCLSSVVYHSSFLVQHDCLLSVVCRPLSVVHQDRPLSVVPQDCPLSVICCSCSLQHKGAATVVSRQQWYKPKWWFVQSEALSRSATSGKPLLRDWWYTACWGGVSVDGRASWVGRVASGQVHMHQSSAPDRLALCPLPPYRLALSATRLSCIVLSATPPLVVFSKARLPHIFYLPLSMWYPLPAHHLHTLPQFDCCIHPPLFAPAALSSIPKVIERHLHHGTIPPITTAKHCLHLSLPPPSPLSIAAVKHCLLLQPSNVIFGCQNSVEDTFFWVSEVIFLRPRNTNSRL